MRAALGVGAVSAWVLLALPARGDEEAPRGSGAGEVDPDARNATSGVVVRGSWPSPRGAGDTRVSRETLEASPRQQTSELLSAAPGFFVDHEDAEGLGNDINFRGFDLEHGGGIELRVSGIPINNPVHVRGQGYADVNFVIPEVVRSLHVQGGPYDPRQGDAAIAGSADFDLGMPRRGYRLGGTYGSFGQTRLLAVAAPRTMGPETFVAVSGRRTDGFGSSRAGHSGAVNAQYGVDLGRSAHLRVFGAAYGAATELAGVLRKDDVDAGRIGFYDSYPSFAEHQSARASRVVLGALLEHTASAGSLELAPWAMWTDLRARQNFTGALQASLVDPNVSGLGDLFETRNEEMAAGLNGHYRSSPRTIGNMRIVVEPGVSLRGGRTGEGKDLLQPSTLSVWDRRLDASVETMDAGAYLDLDVRFFERLRISGGVRADLLLVSVEDHLAGVLPAGAFGTPPGARRDAGGVVVSPRVTTEYAVSERLAVSASYGEGFRSADALHLPDGSTRPFSRVRSVEAGVRADDGQRRLRTSLSLFRTWVENELVFDAESGGFEPEPASIRQGMVGSVLSRPVPWLLSSSSLTVTDAGYVQAAPGASRYVPGVSPVLLRTDLSAHHPLPMIAGKAIVGRVSAGYTLLSGRHLSDGSTGPAWNVLNAGLGAHYGVIDVAIDAYNLLGLRYADSLEIHDSTFGVGPGIGPRTAAMHLDAAAPRAVVGTVTLEL